MNTLPINTGDTAFMILCTAMVCLMTPGLAFFLRRTGTEE